MLYRNGGFGEFQQQTLDWRISLVHCFLLIILQCEEVAIRLVEGGGFEPPKLSRQIYSLIPLAAREPLQLSIRRLIYPWHFYTEAAFYGN